MRFALQSSARSTGKLELYTVAAQHSFSYTLVLLVLHFLQCGVKPAVLPNLQGLYADFFSQQRPLDEIEHSDELPSPLPGI